MPRRILKNRKAKKRLPDTKTPTVGPSPGLALQFCGSLLRCFSQSRKSAMEVRYGTRTDAGAFRILGKR